MTMMAPLPGQLGLFPEAVEGSPLDKRFDAWMLTDEAKEIVEVTRRLNRQIRDRGFQHYSVYALTEVVRWHIHLEKGPSAEGYKVNDVYLSRLARWFMERHPDEFPSRCDCVRHEKEPMTYFELRALRS